MNSPIVRQQISTLFHGGLSVGQKIEKGTFDLTQHPVTGGYAGIFMMGDSRVVQEDFTARTDGRDTEFSAPFIDSLNSMGEVRFVILHENGHKLFLHCVRGRHLKAINPDAFAASIDYAVHSWIIDHLLPLISDKEFIVPIKGILYDPKFKNWSVEEIFRFLHEGKEKEQPNKRPPPVAPGQPCDDGEDGESSKDESEDEQPEDGADGEDTDDQEGGEDADDVTEQGNSQPKPGEMGGAPKPGKGKTTIDGKDWPLESMDEHLPTGSLDSDDEGDEPGEPGQEPGEMSAEEEVELEREIMEALQQGAILAGRMGTPMPRSIDQLLAPEIPWTEQTQDFMTATCSGRDEYTWRQFDKKRYVAGVFQPSVESERPTEMILSCDCSGSITQHQTSIMADHISRICEQLNPERVRVLWWHTAVCGEQVFEESDYPNMKHLLKPNGSGGTRVGCVSDYIVAHRYDPDCVIVFTDGWVENDIDWQVQAPTLWLVTERTGFVPPKGGRMVKFNPKLGT